MNLRTYLFFTNDEVNSTLSLYYRVLTSSGCFSVYTLCGTEIDDTDYQPFPAQKTHMFISFTIVYTIIYSKKKKKLFVIK